MTRIYLFYKITSVEVKGITLIHFVTIFIQYMVVLLEKILDYCLKPPTINKLTRTRIATI